MNAVTKMVPSDQDNYQRANENPHSIILVPSPSPALRNGENQKDGRAVPSSTGSESPQVSSKSPEPHQINAESGQDAQSSEGASSPLGPASLGTGSNLGRRGDSRMHKAVAFRVANPNSSLLEALVEGGFKFPKHLFEAGHSDRDIHDADGVQLCQRKNQLSRRLRLIRKKRDNAAKTSPPNVSEDFLNIQSSNLSAPVLGSGMPSQTADQASVVQILLKAQQQQQQQQQQAAQQVNNYLNLIAAGQNQQNSSAVSNLMKEKKRLFDDGNSYNSQQHQSRRGGGDQDILLSSLTDSQNRDVPGSYFQAPGTGLTHNGASSRGLFPNIARSNGNGLQSSLANLNMSALCGGAGSGNSGMFPSPAPAPLPSTRDVSTYLLQQQILSQKLMLNGAHAMGSNEIGQARNLSDQMIAGIDNQLNHAADIYCQGHEDFVTSCLIKAGLSHSLVHDPTIRASFLHKCQDYENKSGS